MKHYAPFPQILEQLTDALKTQQSGVFFIATDTNESARFSIDAGHIAHCSFRRSHGQAALEELSQINTAKCSFAENSRFPFRDKDIVGHTTALKTLGITLPATTAEGTPEDTPAAAPKDQPEVEIITRIYRGKPVQIPVKPKHREGRSTTKGQRIYRGKLISAD